MSNRGNRNRGGRNRDIDSNSNSQTPPNEPRNDGSENGDGNTGQAKQPSTSAEKAIAGFTAALFFAAVVQAVVSYGQWDIAKKALLDAQTPNIRLSVTGGGVRLSGRIEATTAFVFNSGTVSLFNGKVFVKQAFLPVSQPMAVWDELVYADDIVMGPGDREDFPFRPTVLDPSQRREFMSGEKAVMVAIRVDFPDSGNRMHHRYVCSRWLMSETGGSAGGACPTPTQS